MAEKKSKPGTGAVKKEALKPVMKTATAKASAVKEAAPKKAAAKKETAPKQELKTSAQCIFDLYDIKFGMKRAAIEELFAIGAEDFLVEEQLLHAKAQWIQLFFDHEDRLWQVKASYLMSGPEEAEALLEAMSRNYKFQTPSARVAFEIGDLDGNNMAELKIRYTEANLKRVYLHHMMAVGAAKIAEAEEMEKAIREKEEEEYIPTGPLIF